MTPSKPTEALPTPTQYEVDEAIRFRTRYGLLASESWVREVAVDPTAQASLDLFGVPLMPFENADLMSRSFDRDTFDEVRGYGSMFPDDFAGAYLDEATSRIVVSFKDRVDRHRTALANLLPDDARIDVRQVRWSTEDLNGFIRMVTADQAWFDTIGVRFQAAGRRITEDFINVQYQGRVAAADLIEEHFGRPAWLHVERAFALPWAGERADLVITVTDRDGTPIPDLWCDYWPEDPEAEDGSEDITSTDARGQCTLKDVPAVWYRIRLMQWVDNNHYEPIEEFRTQVTPSGTVVPVVIAAP